MEESKFDPTGDNDFIDSITVAEHNKICSFSSQMNITEGSKRKNKGNKNKNKTADPFEEKCSIQETKGNPTFLPNNTEK